jgi:trehalose 6-phosphate synthase
MFEILDVRRGGRRWRIMRPWTRDRLQQLVRDRLPEYRFIAVSNREPYIHRHVEGAIECIQPASGLATAIDPIMRASGGYLGCAWKREC